MSKKKAMATMSLKDFHNGSIASDLRLSSSPGVFRAVRSGSERNTSVNLENNLIRSDHHRPRPHSSGATHSFDEKVPFLSHPVRIGQNFDEDERRPLDGFSAPRRTISDDAIGSSAPVCHELRPDYASSVRATDRSVVSQSLSLSSAAIDNQGVKGLKASSGNNGHIVTDNWPNAWGVRKDAGGASGVSSGGDAVLKFAQASAVEKVSSRMWQSKTPNNLLPHLIYSKRNVGTHGVSDRVEYGAPHGSQAVADQVAEDGNQSGERVRMGYGQFETQMCEDVWTEAVCFRSQIPPPKSPEISERLLLTVHPSSKPLETLESNYSQGYQQPMESGQPKIASELHRNTNPPKPWPTDVKTGNQLIDRVVERPKLNLKPRSQPLEQSDGSLERERNSLFGGARPRELVLKERGVDNVAINNVDLSQSPGSISSSKKEAISEQVGPTARNSQKFENRPSNRRIGRDFERKDQRMEHDKVEVERRNWRNDKWRSSKDTKEQRPEPETWRKPVEEPYPAPPDTSFGHGKLVSALELAQAFSKSVSDAKSHDLHSTQRSLPGRNNHQVPFSRLTMPTTTHRING